MRCVCIIGHRKIAEDKLGYVREQLQCEVEKAIEDGFTTFLCGMADGVDLEFGAIVAAKKKTHPGLFLEAVIPYTGRAETENPMFKEVLAQCDGTTVLSREYHPDCYYNRNRYLVEYSQRVIAVFDGNEKSGTAQTMRLAAEAKRDLRVIDISGSVAE